MAFAFEVLLDPFSDKASQKLGIKNQNNFVGWSLVMVSLFHKTLFSVLEELDWFF